MIYGNVIYDPDLFENLEPKTTFVHQLEVGDAVLLSDGDLFWIDDIDKFFRSPEISKKYGDNDPIPIGESLYTIYDLRENEISEIPDNAHITIFRKVK